MKTEGEYRLEMNRGIEADKILNHPLVVEYFESRRKAIMHNLETCKHWSDTNERDGLLNMLQSFANFEKSFKQEIRNGKKAESKIKQLLEKVRK